MTKTFLGFRRHNGAVGVRNWVAVISVMDNCNPATRTIIEAVGGTLPVTTLFVRGQFGADLDFALDSLAGLGRNPEHREAFSWWASKNRRLKKWRRRIRADRKAVEVVHLQPNGTIECVAQGTRKAVRMACSLAAQARAVPDVGIWSWVSNAAGPTPPPA